MFNTFQLQQAFIGLAILASTGTLVQETKANRALELAAPLTTLSINLPAHLEGGHEAAASHTHVEQPLAKFQFSNSDPRIQMRDDYRKYTMPKRSSRNNTNAGGTQVFLPEMA